MKLEFQTPSLPHRHKMTSRYFEGNAQPEYHSNVEDFHCQIYFETVDTVANCIVSGFQLKGLHHVSNCEQVHLKGILGRLVPQYVNQLSEFYTEFACDTLQIQLSIFDGSYHSFWQAEGVGDILHNVIDFQKKEQKNLVPQTRGHVHGHDYSIYASNKCQL